MILEEEDIWWGEILDKAEPLLSYADSHVGNGGPVRRNAFAMEWCQ